MELYYNNNKDTVEPLILAALNVHV